MFSPQTSETTEPPIDPLSLAHRQELEVGSGISPDVIAERGYKTVWGARSPDILKAGYKDAQCRGEGWLAPLYSPLGSGESVYKPNSPRQQANHKTIKYEYPKGRRAILDAHPRTLGCLGNPGIPLFVTEGVKKGDSLVSKGAAAISLQGVFGWRGRNASGGATALADWECISLPDRTVYIAFDSDAASNPLVQQARTRLANFLQGKRANVLIIDLPPGPGGSKQGVDDFFAAGNTLVGLTSLAQTFEASKRASESETSFPSDGRFPQTDAGNAELFASLFKDNVRFDHKRRRWVLWRGERWQEDKTEFVTQMAIQAARWRLAEAANITDLKERGAECLWACRSENRPHIAAALEVARSLPTISDTGEAWDRHPFLLGVSNGVVDLRTGQLRPARREDSITRYAPVRFDPAATCPRFDAFLTRVVPDKELREYLQRRSGYLLTGDVSEQDLLFLHGSGANGKTTLMNALMDVLGPDLSIQAAPGLLLQKRNQTHPTEIADVDGARLVASSEVDDGRSFAEALIKQLTGGDRLKARRMHKDFYEFEATFKLVLLANHKPNVKGTDWAIWRRIKLVPFDQTIPPHERDPNLRESLKRELPGILNWMVEGCLAWQRDGMREPESVTKATAEYRVESDPLAQFIGQECIVKEGVRVDATSIYQAYKTWAEAQGYGKFEVLTATSFGKLMVERFERKKGASRNFYRGVGLRVERQESMNVEGLADFTDSTVEGFEQDQDFPQNSKDREEFSGNYPQPSKASTPTKSPWEVSV